MKINGTVIAVAVLALAGIAYFVWALGTPSSSNLVTGNSVENLVAKGDLFEGQITNKNVVPGKFSGVGAYDRNCVSAGNGLTNCHAGITTSKYGVIDFNYVHDMARKPCIAPKENVVVTVLDSSGKATVQRV